MDMAGLPHDSCLDLALKILNQLRTIPLDLLYHTPIPMLLSYIYETWCEGGQRTSSLWEEAKASHLLTKKLTQMVDREEPEKHIHARPPSPHHPLQLAQWLPILQNIYPPDLPAHLGALASHAAEASPNLVPPPVTLQSHPKSHHTWILNQRARTTMRLTLKQAQTQAVTQVVKRMKALLAGALNMGTQVVSLTARLRTLAASLKGQVAVQVPAPNQETRKRNLHQPVKCAQKPMQTLLQPTCCQRSKALTQRRHRG